MKIRLGLGPLCMKDVAAFCGGDYYNFTGDDHVSVEWVCTDSREADRDTMMIAIRGERVDGHDYIEKAMENGCRCFLCEYVPACIAGKSVSAVIAEDSVSVLCRLAHLYRQRKPLRCVAVTGSVGKTTAKEMISAALGERFRVFRTEGNFNSTIGMPLSLMSVGAQEEAAVFEMGMSGFGEIAAMSGAASPDVAVITNIGTSHLEYLGTRENICRAKMEIVTGLRRGGTLVLNGDEPLLRGQHGSAYRTVFVSVETTDADYYADHIRFTASGSVFDLHCPDGACVHVEIPAIGKHMVMEAALAFAAARAIGEEPADIVNGLRQYKTLGLRQNVRPCGQITLIADCYNAAPESMCAALRVLREMKAQNGGRAVAVLGDMLELGQTSPELHRTVGTEVAACGTDLLFTIGERARMYAEGAREGGMPADAVCSFTDGSDLTALTGMLAKTLLPGDTVLVKASHAMCLDRVCTYLDEHFAKAVKNDSETIKDPDGGM